MISALAWIPKGAAKAEPEVAEVTEEELAAMRAAAEAEGGEEGSDTEDEEPSSSDSEMGEEDEAAAVARARAVAAAMKSSKGESGAPSAGGDHLAAAMAELDMDHYDDDSEGEGGGAMARILGGSAGIAFNPADDPLLQRNSDSDTDSEAEAFRIRDDDLLILAARNEDDVSHLEVWVYEPADERGPANLFVHHSLMLPAFPLSVAWLDCDPTGRRDRANIAAVGSFEPGIELWDMDVVDSVEPLATLGGADYAAARAAAAAEAEAAAAEAGSSDKKKKKKKKKKAAPQVPVRPGSHEDAVLGLAWNPGFRNVLASASADQTVKVWDVATQQCQHTLRHHSDKVQAVAWNPAEPPVLLSGGFDKRACLLDMRQPDAASVPSWQLSADVEALAWDPHHPTQFVVSSEDGVVAAYDARQGAGSSALYRLSAHDKATCALSFCPAVPGLLATSSTDKKVKVWSMLENKPTLLATENLNVGAVFGMSFCRDAPLILAAGGAKGSVSVWDTMSSAAVNSFVQRHTPEVAAAASGGEQQQQEAAA
ncbi:putative WD repeat-containing [Chlorella sorokiniana]|uniref:WD repeat-containing n=1 Tax=Chlorella sorokiniana TaxID=3076 RepID=A0A2P6TRR2_CHLSO|nr:putative WD repeat-containing [Chlorella sorokiniana]|eukprot:PRW56745.1 putative WD repeat-containing [Chlorella sorokiniana]